MRTNNPVLISFIEATLKEHDIFVAVLDANMAITDGVLPILARRIMVSDEDGAEVLNLLLETEAADQLSRKFAQTFWEEAKALRS